MPIQGLHIYTIIVRMHVLIGECDVGDSGKVDCGYFGIIQAGCEANGCCWKESSVSGVPYCFHKVGESERSGIQ